MARHPSPLPSRRSWPAAAALAACLALAGLACDSPAGPRCEGGPSPATVSLWTDCSEFAVTAPAIPVTLTNLEDEHVVFFHECGSEAPWPEQLQDDGTWLRLLPPDFFLTTGCAHAMELAPGESVELEMSMARVPGPGVYKIVTMVGRHCEHVHEPVHVPHSCESLDFIESAPFELR